MNRSHRFTATISWTGNKGNGTFDYNSYDRDHVISIEGKPPIHGSSDAAFRGDASKYSPEDLFVSSISGCHMLWYLHLCAVNGVIVSGYTDKAVGIMDENQDGSGQFKEVTLHPHVTVTDETMVEKAGALHAFASSMCFIARSVNFPIHHIPKISSREKA